MIQTSVFSQPKLGLLKYFLLKNERAKIPKLEVTPEAKKNRSLATKNKETAACLRCIIKRLILYASFSVSHFALNIIEGKGRQC